MTLDEIALPLFLPAARLDRLDKALNSGADAVILDLEDAVSEAEKPGARAGLKGALPDTPPVPVLLRINGGDTPFFDEDVSAASVLPVAAIVVPKASDRGICAEVTRRTGKPVIGIIESALGVHHAHDVAGACRRLAFGSIDLAADLGIAHDRQALAFARSAVVMASRLAGLVPPWDGVTIATGDAEAVADDCRHGTMMGFGGKMLIHPAQIAPARAAMAPSGAERDWAHRVVAAAEKSTDAVKLDGEMIDAPVVARARQILARADRVR
ncbi:CoA ester lyase [Palleronia sp. LCG004]|uniref:HpcH/HpaI aldolase/citrate lyase family protein n=1 Tax=Palleronia sp. LCG004 TaxID=3079304 RepID=UPI0029425D51|nr:CoA ester lyase [Palleronia sp. LCG004]WOI57733.1 CoA ester lyase [Palleronia sp. LCG004]